MNSYNEIKHEKVISDKKNNELLTSLIKLGHDKEKEVAELLMGKTYLNSLTDMLATTTEADLSKLINYIVRETKRKKK